MASYPTDYPYFVTAYYASSVERVIYKGDSEQEARQKYEKACKNAKVLVATLYKDGKEELVYYHPSFTKEAQ